MKGVLVVALGLGLAGCAENTTVGRCVRGSDCPGGVCVVGRCEAPSDAGRDQAATLDLGASDAPIDAAADARDARVSDLRTEDARDMRREDANVPDAAVGPCGDAPCNALFSGDGEWTTRRRGAVAFAPSAPVLAAFDIETAGRAFVLTAGSVHTLRLSDGEYVASATLATLFPEVEGSVVTANSIPAGHAGGDPNVEGVQLTTINRAYQYAYDLTTGRFSFRPPVITDFGAPWAGGLAPDRARIVGDWLALSNDDLWVPGTPLATCGTGGATFTVYIATLTADEAHIFDAGVCNDFVVRMPLADFGPFAFPDAPAGGSIGAIFFNDGRIWVIPRE